MSIISQCLMAAGVPPHGKKCFAPPWRDAAEDVERLEDHIVRFCLGGIRAIRRAAHPATNVEQTKTVHT